MHDEPETLAHRGARRIALRVAYAVGLVLLVGWTAFWIESFRRFEMVAKLDMAFNPWTFLGLDYRHNLQAVQTWVAGGNPYVDGIDETGKPLTYPPIVLPMFAWGALTSHAVGTAIWAGVIALIVSWAGRVVLRLRAANGLPFIPLVLAVALLLWSEPVMFAMERGSGDAIVLMCVLGAALAWRREGPVVADIVIGACLAVAAWVKVYPVVLFAAPATTARWRALLVGLAVVAAIGLLPYRYTVQFLQTSHRGQADRVQAIEAAMAWLTWRDYVPPPPAPPPPGALPWVTPAIEFSSHSLTTYWPKMSKDVRLPALARVPGLIGAGIVLFPLGAWVTWRFRRSARRERWVLAYMLWLAALATFWMPLSYDYNLLFLPLAILAVWDYRDGWVSNVALLGPTWFWWQPLWLDDKPFTPALVFLLKVISLVLTAQALVRRLNDEPSRDAAAHRERATDRAGDEPEVLTHVS